MMGIGGTGMSGMAEILLYHGFSISGCDSAEQEILDHLRDRGAVISIGHNPDHVIESDVVVYSSAVPTDHPELAFARKSRIPTIKRAEMLGELSRLHVTVAVSGTHGKTTTTSLIGFLADRLELDPTVIVGGRLISLPGHARVGSGPMVIEADEFDRSLRNIHPTLAVMTNVDRDHLDCYRDFADICETFLSYLQHVPFFGKVILNVDDSVQTSFLPQINRPVITYGTGGQVDFKISEVEKTEEGTCFTCSVIPADQKYRVMIPLFGTHNVYNATAALAALWDLTGSKDQLAGAVRFMKDFPGVSRRFESIGAIEGRPVISDYAHHPREVQAALEAAMQAFPGRPVIALFQPHLYSRTRLFSHEFSKSLMVADHVIVLPVYPAREEPIVGVTGESIVHGLRLEGHAGALFLPDVVSAVAKVKQSLPEDAIVLALGAGSIHIHLLRELGGVHAKKR